MAEQYLPLYRKYRPQQFSDLIGQDNLVKAMENAINTGKIAHAYLFCGPRGTGKTSSARILAKSLNCKDGPTMTPCGKCVSCQDILNGNMLDVVEMDAASNRSVEDAQNIIDKIHYAPVNGKYKIFIIDEVHMISKQAFNALLKTLEEPPENVIFILATTEPQKVLETIISRCQRFDFRRITVDDIVKRLKYVSEQENIKISDDALYAIAKSSQGGMRDALALLDQVSVLDMEKEITSKDVNDILGKIDTETLLEISKAIFANTVDDVIQKINNIYSKGNEPLQIIENFITFFRNLSVIKTCRDIKSIITLTLLTEDDIKKIQEFVSGIAIEKIAYTIEKLTSYYKEIKFTNNRYLWLELCFIDIASGSCCNTVQSLPQATIQTVITQSQEKLQQVELPKKEVQEIPQEEPIVEIKEQKDVKPVDTEEIKPVVAKQADNTDDAWQNILNLIKSPPSRSFFNTFAKPANLSAESVILMFKDVAIMERAKETPKFDTLKNACMAFFNVTSIHIEMNIGTVPKNTKTTMPIKSKNIVEQKPTVEDVPSPNGEVDEIDDVVVDVPKNLTNTAQEDELSDEVQMVKKLFDAKVFED